MTISQYSKILGRKAAQGQRYCRDARKPIFTKVEYLECYRRFTVEALRLITKFNLLKDEITQ